MDKLVKSIKPRIGSIVKVINKSDKGDAVVVGEVSAISKHYVDIYFAGNITRKFSKKELYKATREELDAFAEVIETAIKQEKEKKEASAASPKKKKDIGDRVAVLLRSLVLDEIYHLTADILEVSATDLYNKYRKLNVGRQRMVLGNLIRGHQRRMRKAAEAENNEE